MFHSILAHWKGLAIVTAITSVITWIGLVANQLTSPKILAAMVFLSDWNMIRTWEWWTRMIIFLSLSAGAWFYQKRKADKKFAESELAWREQVVSLQGEIRHLELMLSTARTQITVFEGRK